MELWGGLAGMAVVVLPFLVYFLVQGNLSAFISEYFCNTYSTVGKPFKETLLAYLHGWLTVKKSFILFLVGIILFCRKYKISYWLIFCLFTFLSIAVYGVLPYYNTILMPFVIFLFIVLADWLERKISLTRTKVVFVSLLCLFLGVAFNLHTERFFVFQDNKYRQSYYDVSQLMAQIEHPKVLFYTYDMGQGVLADALPACKYWARQNGATPAMEQERRAALKAQKADFIFVGPFDSPFVDVTPQELNELHYVCWGKVIGNGSDKFNVYCRKELYKKLPHVQLSTKDLLLKRNPISIK